MILSLLAAFHGAAQQAFVVYERAESSHFVENHPGSTYSWNVLTDFSPDTEANPVDYSFISSNGSYQIQIHWNKAGWYYLNVTETDITGCKNRKVLAVNVISNNSSIAFNSTVSSDCFNLSDNGFELPLQILDDGGIPLDEAEFPVDVEFTVNGKSYTEDIVYDQQVLNINTSWFTQDKENESQVIVQLTGATNNQGTDIPLLEGNNIHTRTIHPVPQLEIIYDKSSINEHDYGIYEAVLSVGEPEGAIYNWFIDPPRGSSTDLSGISNSTIKVLWDGPVGEYTVNVNVEDGNNCKSDTISQVVTINKSAPDPITVNAGPDTIIGSCQSFEFSMVSPVNPDYSYSWQPADYLSDPTIPNPIFTAGKTTTYVLTVTTLPGYDYKDTVTINVSEVMANAGEDVIMEKESTTQLNGSESSGDNLVYNWTTENGAIKEGGTTAYPVVSQPGTYYLEVKDAFGCPASDSVNVSLYANAPVARDDYDTAAFQTAVVIDVLANDSDADGNLNPSSLTILNNPVNGALDINYFENTITYTPNQNFVGTDMFEYRICDLTQLCDNATVYVLVTPINFLIPQAFTPNGDNINDFFQILGIEYYPNNTLTVINRWGKKVYEAKAYGISTTPKFWDGRSNVGSSNGDLPTGTYFYVLDLGNGEKPIAGSVYIDR